MAHHGNRQGVAKEVMKKPRRNSLFAKLCATAKGDVVFSWIHEGVMTYAEIASRVKEEFGIETTSDAVQELYRRRGFEWRMKQARQRAEEQAALLPDDFDETRKRALAQREFVAVLENLSFREIMLAQRLELDREKLKLKQELEPKNYELAKRKVDMLEGKFSSAAEAAGNSTLTPAEKQERIRQIFGLA